MEIGRLAAQAGLTVDAVRYYEKAGLLDAPPRDSGGRRQYAEADVSRLGFIQKLRQTGMPIRGVKAYVDLIREGDHTTTERLAILEAHRASVSAHLDQVQADLAAIDRKIEIYRKA